MYMYHVCTPVQLYFFPICYLIHLSADVDQEKFLYVCLVDDDDNEIFQINFID